MKIYDLSITLDVDAPTEPAFNKPKITYQKHEETVAVVAKMCNMGDDWTIDDIPNGLGYANEIYECGAHSNTHMDAPWHYSPTMNDGERAWTIEEIPLEWCFGPGVVLDFSDKPDGYIITAEDVEAEFQRIGYEMCPGTIVLVRSGAEHAYGTSKYFDAGAGFSAEATIWLCERGMHVCGTDAWGWDIPFKYQAENWAKDHDKSKIWQGHLAGMHHAYCHLEKLYNLKQLPSKGFTVYAFPCKVKGGSAGWCRVVAMSEED